MVGRGYLSGLEHNDLLGATINVLVTFRSFVDIHHGAGQAMPLAGMVHDLLNSVGLLVVL